MKASTKYVNLLLIFLVILGLNILGKYWKVQIDLTEDNIHSLTQASKDLIQEIEDPVLVTVLLEGDFPAGFKRLRNNARGLLDKFHSLNHLIEYQFQNPSEGSVTQINERRAELAKDGMLPTSLRYQQGDEMTNKQIYPYAIVMLGNRRIIVNLLEEQHTGMSDEVSLNNSVSLLEYKFADALQKLTLLEKPVILFTEGNGELSPYQTSALVSTLSPYYHFGRVDLDSVYGISREVELLLVAKPTLGFTERDKFILDQYLMHGGKIIWLIDRLNVNLDSINQNNFYVPAPLALGLDDLFFNHGVRYQNDLVMDLECTRIPQVVGMSGNKPQIDLIPWPYHPLVIPQADHPITKNIDRVNLNFPGSIDTLATISSIRHTVLLQSGEYTRYQMTPVRLSFEILKYGFDPDLFDKEPRTFAVLAEGRFESIYKNRLSESMLGMLESIGMEYRETSPETRQIFIADGDLVKNLYDAETERYSPLGYNKWEKQIFSGNGAFIVNSIEFMLDRNGILASRSKERKLRLIDKVKASTEKTKWRLINIAFPLIVVLFMGLMYNYWRRLKYAK